MWNENQTYLDLEIPSGVTLMAMRPMGTLKYVLIYRLIFAKSDTQKVTEWLEGLLNVCKSAAGVNVQQIIKDETVECKHDGLTYADKEYGTIFCMNCHAQLKEKKHGD